MCRMEVIWKRSLRTTELIDALCTRTESGEPLCTELLLKNCLAVGNEDVFSVSLLLRRFDWREDFINDFMTFSRFRSLTMRSYDSGGNYPALISQILKLDRREGWHEFDRAVLLHAQDSGRCRTSGSRKFGQTCTYMFTGAVLERIDNNV